MITALLTALLVVLVGARCRPRPRRQLDTTEATPRRLVPSLRRPTPRDGDPGAVAAWCDQVSRALRSGSTLAAAIRSSDPPQHCRRDVAEVVLALDRGIPLHEAVGVRPGAAHLEVAFGVVRACAIHGGPAGEPLDRAAATLRARSIDLADRRTQSAQARLSAIVMTVLPIVMLSALLAASAPVRGALMSGPGLIVATIGGLLNLAGWRWMRRLIDGSPR